MAQQKHTIGTGVAVGFLSASVILDALKIFLFFVQALPIAGTVIDVGADEIIGFIEDIFIFGGLGLCGAFKGKSFGSSVLAVLGGAVINAVPEADTFPSTTLTVFYIIARSRAQDKIEHRKTLAAEKNTAVQDQQARQEAAQAAAARAQAMRVQALEASRRVANDNGAVENKNAA